MWNCPKGKVFEVMDGNVHSKDINGRERTAWMT
jgi:hypothetical protein